MTTTYRLAAILAVDLVAYSSLIAAGEVGTLNQTAVDPAELNLRTTPCVHYVKGFGIFGKSTRGAGK